MVLGVQKTTMYTKVIQLIKLNKAHELQRLF